MLSEMLFMTRRQLQDSLHKRRVALCFQEMTDGLLTFFFHTGQGVEMRRWT